MPKIHVLLTNFDSRDNITAMFEFDLPTSATSFLLEHKVQGQTTLGVGTLLDMTMAGSYTLLGGPSTSTLSMQSSSTVVTKQIDSWTKTLSCRVIIHSGDIKIMSSSTHLTTCVRTLMKLNTSGIGKYRFMEAMNGVWNASSIMANLAMKTRSPHMVATKAILPKEHRSSEFVAHPTLLHAIMTAQYVSLGHPHHPSLIGTTCAAICIEPYEDPRESTHIVSIANDQLTSGFGSNHFIDARGNETAKILQLKMRHWQERRSLTSSTSPTLCLSYMAQSLALAKLGMPITSTKWLILSQDHLYIASICTCLDMPLAVTVVSMSTTCAAYAYGVHIGNEEDFLQLLWASEADKCLLVHDTFDTEIDRCIRGAHALAALAMLWAYRAFARAQPRYKICTISITDGMNATQPLSIFPQGMSHTHYVNSLALRSAIPYSSRCCAPKVNSYINADHFSFADFAQYRHGKDIFHGR